jgi:hypothetical protein
MQIATLQKDALDAAISELQKKHGKGSIMRLGDTPMQSV